jgi:hypothetical protein
MTVGTRLPDWVHPANFPPVRTGPDSSGAAETSQTRYAVRDLCWVARCLLLADEERTAETGPELKRWHGLLLPRVAKYSAINNSLTRSHSSV